MRIALIGRRFDPAGGGTERDLAITADILMRAGHEVSLYADEVRSQTDGLRVRRIGGPRMGRALGLWWFANRAGRIARLEGAEVVFSFARITDADILRSGGSAHSSYLLAARRWLSPSGVTALRLSPYHRVQVTVERRGFASPGLKRAIAVSDLVRLDLIETFSLAHRKALTLYNGVDLERFRPRTDDAIRVRMRRQFEIPQAAPTAIFIGNGFARKGLRFLIEAWPALDQNAHLIVAGTDQAITSYRRLANRLGIAARIRFVGPQDRIEDVFAAADALAMPSLFEPFGNVIMEAMASGLPVLCSAACGAAETLPREFREFVLSDPTEITELAARMKMVLAVGRDLSQVARDAAEHFTWDRYGRELLDLIQSL
jgi:UDP-glucose:(heptosyl)LPS alpha-1,3-glucosyltransferase